jgi:hypothetical protein
MPWFAQIVLDQRISGGGFETRLSALSLWSEQEIMAGTFLETRLGVDRASQSDKRSS